MKTHYRAEETLPGLENCPGMPLGDSPREVCMRGKENNIFLLFFPAGWWKNPSFST